MTARSTDYFVMSVVVIEGGDMAAVRQTLGEARRDLGRRPGDTLSWKNIKSHSQRLRAAQLVGAAPLTIASVVVCKRFLTTSLPTEEHAYLYTLRYLLERLSWLGRDRSAEVEHTLAHITRFRLSTLREYEARLRATPGCQIAWETLCHPGRISTSEAGEPRH